MDRFRIDLDDPDAAEKAANLYVRLVAPQVNTPANENEAAAMRAVLDAIEQPRLPTRSQVEAKAGANRWVGRFMVDNDWATEDPEPELDPAPLADFLAAELIHATRAAGITPGAVASAGQFTIIARNLLASGRVQVTPQ